MRSFIKTSLLQKGGRILLGSFMVAVAIGHLTNKRKEFQAQVPDSLPADKDVVVLGSGLAELSLGLSMLFWKSERVGWAPPWPCFTPLFFQETSHNTFTSAMPSA